MKAYLAKEMGEQNSEIDLYTSQENMSINDKSKVVMSLDIILICFVVNVLSLLTLVLGSYEYLMAELTNVAISLAMTIMIIMYRKPKVKTGETNA